MKRMLTLFLMLMVFSCPALAEAETDIPEEEIIDYPVELSGDDLLEPGDLLVDYFTRVVGTPMEMPYSETVLYAYSEDSLLLETYHNGGTDNETVTQYLVPVEAYEDILEVIRQTGMDTWNDEEGYAITGVYTVCKFQDGDRFIRVTSEHMPLDGENDFDTVAWAMGKWVDDKYLISGPADEENDILGGLSGEALDYSFERNEKTGSSVFHILCGLENSGSEAIMEIHYALTLLDVEGAELDEIKRTWNGQDTPLLPGEAIEHASGGQIKIDGEVADIRLSILSAATAEEMPPIHVPQPGEFLYQALDNEHIRNIDTEMPVMFRLWIDHGGDRSEAEITDPETIGTLVDAFMKIRIREETDESVTDNYNGFSMTFADGELCTVNLEMYALDYSIYGTQHLFRLDDFGSFWELMELLTEDADYYGGGS